MRLPHFFSIRSNHARKAAPTTTEHNDGTCSVIEILVIVIIMAIQAKRISLIQYSIDRRGHYLTDTILFWLAPILNSRSPLTLPHVSN